MRIVGKKDVVQTLGLVTRNAWEVAVRAENQDAALRMLDEMMPEGPSRHCFCLESTQPRPNPSRYCTRPSIR